VNEDEHPVSHANFFCCAFLEYPINVLYLIDLPAIMSFWDLFSMHNIVAPGYKVGHMARH